MASKATRPKNALAHGLYASDLVLAWENEQDFVDLHDAIRQELNPVGSLEDIAVLDIARLHWVKRRLNVGAQLAYHRHPDAPALTKAGKEGWQGVRNYLREKAGDTDTLAMRIRDNSKEYLTAQNQLMRLFNKRTEQMSSVTDDYKPKLRRIPQTDGYDLVETISAEVQFLGELVDKLESVGAQIVPMLKLIENFDLEQAPSERAYRPDVVERTAKVEAQIDKQIEKALARLANLKEFKRIYVPKTVEGRRVDGIEAVSSSSSEAAGD
jgi:hypothetical protein